MYTIKTNGGKPMVYLVVGSTVARGFTGGFSSDTLVSLLKNSLKRGKKYKLTLKYKVGTSWTDFSYNGLGVSFFSNKIGSTLNFSLNSSRIVENRDWHYFEKEFVATNDFDSILIGNTLSVRDHKYTEAAPDNMQYNGVYDRLNCRIHIDDIFLIEVF
jgi:hypothetical protein